MFAMIVLVAIRRHRIAALYAIEQDMRGRSRDERRQVRNARARPLLESMSA
jgi:hypothetical protein